MKSKFLEDSHGNKSSKRLWGSIILAFGILFAVVLFAFSLIYTSEGVGTCLSIIDLFFVVGSGLLGVGIFERSK